MPALLSRSSLPSLDEKPLPKIVFVTGTDTGVGKTVLTGLLLAYKQARGERVYAMKPFCSGDRADAELLYRLQRDELRLEEINPFFFEEPLAPWVAARRLKRRAPDLGEVLEQIQVVARRLGPGGTLLIEGAGGLLVPLGNDYSVLDLIIALRCDAIVVASNKLGTINHTLLSVHAIECARRGSVENRLRKTKVALMNRAQAELSTASNPKVLSARLAPVPLLSLPFLGPKPSSFRAIRRHEKKLKKTLARLLD
ncbi:MAG TPA: dethiobiotin synthase [Verrucomicrobiae bacterium]|nr:dethiobiotin synthase [Verrucomicrobiae bacterium]